MDRSQPLPSEAVREHELEKMEPAMHVSIFISFGSNILEALLQSQGWYPSAWGGGGLGKFPKNVNKTDIYL